MADVPSGRSGFCGGPRPQEVSGWLKRALTDYRLLLLDQRGTGRSSPIAGRSLSRVAGAVAQAKSLTHFRADSIVADAEAIRRGLVDKDERWTVLGQIRRSGRARCGSVHGRATADRSVSRRRVPCRVPDRVGEEPALLRALSRDEALVCRIVDHLGASDVRLADGNRLSPRRFQQLGIDFGASNGFEHVHYLPEEAFADGEDGTELGFAFLVYFDQAFSFQTNPIYAILHEPLYAQRCATRWAAERVRAEFPEFDASRPGRVLFTGEMVYPWMFEECKELRPLRVAADLLAERSDWPKLHDRAFLGRNKVPCAAAVYVHDMYVERASSEETAAVVRGMRMWVTSEYEHNGLRLDGERVLGRLLDLVHSAA